METVSVSNTKPCSRCNQPTPLENFYPVKRKSGKLSLSSDCKECQKKRTQAWRKRRPDLVLKQHQEYYRKNPQVQRAIQIRLKYGLTPEDVERITQSQSNKCLGCGVDLSTIVKHIDHCHKTKVVRGILCGPCNHTIGHAKDKPAVLRKLADYLDAYSGVSKALNYLA